MSEVVVIKVPSVKQNGEPIAPYVRGLLVEKAVSTFEALFGGGDIVEATGFWNGTREHITRVESTCDATDYLGADEETWERVEALACLIAHEGEQDCVFCSYTHGGSTVVELVDRGWNPRHAQASCEARGICSFEASACEHYCAVYARSQGGE